MTADLVVIVPTRERPHSVALLSEAFADTCTEETWLLWCVDECLQVGEYEDQILRARRLYPQQRMLTNPPMSYVAAMNFHANKLLQVASRTPLFALAMLSDDHRPETVGWDQRYLAALRELGTGIVYGDDGHQGATLPTQMAITTDIIDALGYVAPPVLEHMYCDNYWKDLGEGAHCLRYLPDVKVTHYHPGAGKGVWDDSYRRTNAAEKYAQDKVAYDAFRDSGQLAYDITTVNAVRSKR